MSEIEGDWALILGSSSGFGEATSRALAREGVNIAGVHFDRKSEMDRINELIEDLENEGVQVEFFNQNAASEDTRDDVVGFLGENIGSDQQLRVLMHSLAFGTLVRFVEDVGSDDDEDTITPKQMDMTLDVMAHTLVYWTQDVVGAGLMDEGSRIYAMTSAGGHKAWPNYGAVSAAKAALEAHIRQLTVELGDRGITANAIQAGVTDTPALRKIPGHEKMLEHARETNPSGRMTEPEDVAKTIAMLSQPDSQFVTGNVIRCDGGEDITR
jgi:NAD(P)-dependent dehydrogenase (short-subunit alcohol dehydrogenase family)